MLLGHHFADLRSSGLTDATIEASGIYSESDHDEIRRLLNWKRQAKSLGPCLVFPYRQSNGEFNGFAKLKPDNPQTINGKARKYEQPLGVSPKPYLTPAAIAEIQDRFFGGLTFTEGEKKANAASQAGYPCIGLSGPFGWTKKRADKTQPRTLIDELAAIDWNGRHGTIIFDTDPRRNFGVNHGLAELARLLTEHGAIVRIIWLPVGPPDRDGIPCKQGIDDFIVRYGVGAFREFVESQRIERATCNLDEYREQLAISRVDSIGKRRVYLDTSPVGSGKSYADKSACQKATTSLTIQPTHKNCQETETSYTDFGLNAVAYPPLNRDTCQNFDEAELAVRHGLSVSQAVCPTCPFFGGCEYQAIFADAEAAPHRIATHKRASLGLEQLAEGRNYVAIHEESSDLLRPKFESSKGLEKVAEVAAKARAHANELLKGEDRATAQHFFWQMEQIANDLIRQLSSGDTTVPIELPVAAGSPPGLDAKLFRAMKESNTWPIGEAMQLVKSLAAGEIGELVVRRDQIRKKGKKDEFETKQAIVGFKQTKLPENAAVWICDATANHHETEILAGRPITHCTPSGSIERQHAAVQIPIDIKQSTSPSKFVGIIRATLMAIPSEFSRIGVICDQRHKPAILGTAKKGPNLEKEHRERIPKVEHFRSGSSRGSNEWLDSCDAIIVAGTPRVPPSAVKNRLIQLGMIEAACRSADWIEWGRDYWSGVTTSGRRLTVQGTGYRDRDWQAAYRAIVASELQQSIGRGRGICENGIPVIVLSNEPLELPLADFELKPLTESEVEILNKLTQLVSKGLEGVDSDNQLTQQLSKGLQPELTQHFPNNILGNGCVSTSEIATAIGKSCQYVRKTLADLAERGHVHRVGKRLGWIPTQPPTIDLRARGGGDIERQAATSSVSGHAARPERRYVDDSRDKQSQNAETRRVAAGGNHDESLTPATKQLELFSDDATMAKLRRIEADEQRLPH